MDFHKKLIGRCLWVPGTSRIHRIEIKMGFDLECTMCGIPYGNDRFQASLDARNFADSQKRNLKWASVIMESKIKGFP